MALLLVFIALIAAASTAALTDWRRGWLFAVLIGVLQDPVRKLTPGMPVYLTFSILGVYIAILVGAQRQLALSARDFTRRFGLLWTAFGVVALCLALAFINGVMTFGIGLWRVPMLSLFTYLAPLPAILLGYAYLDREERLDRFLAFYAILTSVALIGASLEYFRIDFPALGMVQQVGDYIRHLPGIQIRMISGFYRAPDIMGWHAATLASIGIAMMVKEEIGRRAVPWMFAAAWGFYNCMISGRRKAVYYVAVFSAVFVWRYVRRLNMRQTIAVVLSGVLVFLVIHKISTDEESNVYARGAVASQEEFAQRFEGGTFETIRQSGFMGVGLGSATQGVQHLISASQRIGWQEGGLGKLTIELGVPGLLAATLFGLIAANLAMRISSVPDHPATSQVSRVTLLSLVAANVGNFTASAQAYSDPVLALMTCFFVGALFATARLDEDVAVEGAAAPSMVVYAERA